MARPYLGNPKRTIEIIQKYPFTFRKRFGQNFLIDEHVLQKIISSSGTGKEDFVIEVGPGIGTLTQYLAEAAREVTAVEVDRDLIPILNETLREWDNVTILNQDILQTDLNGLVRERNAGQPVRVVANLPYYITTPIIMKLFESGVPLKSVTVMVQKEVARRMQQDPGSKEYGALSLAVQYYARPSIAAIVPQNCFIPRPRVESAVIQLDCYETPPVKVKDEKQMFRLIRSSFMQRRKTLVNGIRNSPDFKLEKEEIERALISCGLDVNIRGEMLSLEQFARLSDELGETLAGRMP